MVDVNNDHVKQTFGAHTDMGWPEFAEKAHGHFDKVRDDMSLGYHISFETRTMSQLNCEFHWNTAMTRMRERVMSVRTRVVTMELKNMVSDALSRIEKVLTLRAA